MLILGGGGMLGHKLWQQLSQRQAFETWATVRKSRDNYHKIPFFRSPRLLDGVNVEDFPRVRSLLNELRPQAVINCIAVTKRHMKPDQASSAIYLNALLPHLLTDWAAEAGSKVVHFSTDCVFDGRLGGYTESDLTNAEDAYGRTKALGEVHSSHGLTLRSSFIGRELSAGTELVEWFLAQRGGVAEGYQRAFYTGLTTIETVKVVEKVLLEFPQLSGLHHVASEPIDKYALLSLVNEAFGLGVQLKPNSTVVCHRNLSGERFSKTTGYRAPSWKEMIRALAADPTPYEDWRA